MKKPKKDSWPLNLIWAVAEKVADEEGIVIKLPVNKNHKKGVHHALDSLPKTVARLVLQCYSENMTLSEIGTRNRMKPKRVEQIVEHGIRLLSAPAMRDYVFYGYDYANRAEDARRLENELKIKERVLANRESKIAEKEKLQHQSVTALSHLSSCEEFWTIEDLELSAYTYNCLKRSGCKSIEDLISKVTNGDLTRTRGIGRACAKDVLIKIYKFTGEDFSHLYGIKLDLDTD